MKTWALTEAGQAVITPAIDPMHVKAYEEGRKMGLTDAQVANLLIRMGLNPLGAPVRSGGRGAHRCTGLCTCTLDVRFRLIYAHIS